MAGHRRGTTFGSGTEMGQLAARNSRFAVRTTGGPEHSQEWTYLALDVEDSDYAPVSSDSPGRVLTRGAVSLPRLAIVSIERGLSRYVAVSLI